MAPAALSAMFASSRSATIFASLIVPLDALAPVELDAIPDVSMLEVVVEVAVVSAPLLSFLPHAATAKVATASIATLDFDTAICPPPLDYQEKTAPWWRRCGSVTALRQKTYA